MASWPSWIGRVPGVLNTWGFVTSALKYGLLGSICTRRHIWHNTPRLHVIHLANPIIALQTPIHCYGVTRAKTQPTVWPENTAQMHGRSWTLVLLHKPYSNGSWILKPSWFLILMSCDWCERLGIRSRAVQSWQSTFQGDWLREAWVRWVLKNSPAKLLILVGRGGDIAHKSLRQAIRQYAKRDFVKLALPAGWREGQLAAKAKNLAGAESTFGWEIFKFFIA